MLWLLTGLFAGHRFYLGTDDALIRAITLNYLVFGWLIDMCLIGDLVFDANQAIVKAARDAAVQKAREASDRNSSPASKRNRQRKEDALQRGLAASPSSDSGSEAGRRGSRGRGRGRGGGRNGSFGVGRSRQSRGENEQPTESAASSRNGSIVEAPQRKRSLVMAG